MASVIALHMLHRDAIDETFMPEDDGNCEGETQPKLVAKHRNGMPGVTVVAPVSVRHFVTRVRVRRQVIIVVHVVHLQSRTRGTAVVGVEDSLTPEGVARGSRW